VSSTDWAGVRRQLRTGTLTTVVVALLGAPLGLLWQAISPSVRYAVVNGEAVLLDPETQALISTDGRFAILAGLAGIGCGAGAYFAAGRNTDVAVVTGLAIGGAAAAVLAWRAGHQVGLGTFESMVAGSADGAVITGVADLRALGVVVFWPVVAVGVFGLCDAVDLAGRHRHVPDLGPAFGDGGGTGPPEPDQAGGGRLDLQAAPTGRDKDRAEP
jgi:hypothetical protein